MACKNYTELISEFIDGQLDSAKVEILQQHLASCKACQDELEKLKIMKEVCGVIKEVEVPKDFHADLMRRISNEKKSEVKASYHLKWLRSLSAIAAVFLVGVILIKVPIINLNPSVEHRALTTDESSNITRETSEEVPHAEVAKSAQFLAEDPLEQIKETRWQVETSSIDSFIEHLNEYGEQEAFTITYESLEEWPIIIKVSGVEDYKALKVYLENCVQELQIVEVETGGDILEITLEE